MDYLPNRRLAEVLLPAYSPCRLFGHCPEARWEPESGQIPRGFLGATGTLEEVKVVMVMAEPASPKDQPRYQLDSDAEGMMHQAISNTYWHMSTEAGVFHKHARLFLDLCFPELDFNEQLGHVWITELRLCSIQENLGNVRDRSCARMYLKQQFELLPQATVVAFGGKAHRGLLEIGINHIEAHAFAKPGCYQAKARPSWEAAAERVRLRLGEAV